METLQTKETKLEIGHCCFKNNGSAASFLTNLLFFSVQVMMSSSGTLKDPKVRG